jgi:cohesin complex subunit SCC1
MRCGYVAMTDSILFPEAPIALRLSGHLLLGVVRIYSRKVNYLFHDCSEALTKIKQAFHAGAVDLPPEHATAPFHAITLPERESVLLASGYVV